MIATIKQKCEDNLAAGVPTVDLVINREKDEAEYLAPGKKGPKGVVLVPYVKQGIQSGWVVNFNCQQLLDYFNGAD